MTEVASIVSIIVGFMSMGLAGFAILIARSSEKESQRNFQRTRDLLAEIDKRTEVTGTLINDSQKQLLGTVIGLVSPKAPTTGEQDDRNMEMGLKLFQTILQGNSPEEAEKIFNLLSSFGGERPN